MNIHRLSKTNNQFAFKSKNCPVLPFSIETDMGALHIEEIQDSELRPAASFLYTSGIKTFDNFAKQAEKFNPQQIASFLDSTENFYRNIFNQPEGNSTILVGKDNKNKIHALFSLGNLDAYKAHNVNISDTKTGHIDTCLIDSEYRGKGVGTTILKKLISTIDSQYTDLYLEANNRKAVKFYQREGFKELDKSNPQIKRIIGIVKRLRTDSNLVTLMSKTIDAKNPWWKRISRNIK